jgi:hypothetical protein
MKSCARSYLSTFAFVGLVLGVVAGCAADPDADTPARATSEIPASCQLAAAEPLLAGPLQNKICPPPKRCVVWGDPPRDHVCLVCQ